MRSEPVGEQPSQLLGLSDAEVSVLLGPLHEERLRIDRIVTRLDVTDDLVERADLGSELVRSVSRYEDTLERAVFSRPEGSADRTLGELSRNRDQLRDAMTVIHKRTMGIDPRNVHASDAQGFEDALDAVVEGLRALLPAEDRQIAALVGSLGPEDRRQLAEDVAHRFHSASERPRPAHTTVGRIISNAHIKLDHTFEDVAAPTHPGADTVNG
jgi:hypothetical protein